MAPSNPGQFEAFTTKPAPKPEPRTQARDFIAQYLGKGTGNAQDQVRDLTDDEVAQIVVAGDTNRRDQPAARRQIKDVLTRAYDRRRREHEKAAQAEMEQATSPASSDTPPAESPAGPAATVQATDETPPLSA